MAKTEKEVLDYEYRIVAIENGFLLYYGSDYSEQGGSPAKRPEYFQTADDARYAILADVTKSIKERRPEAA